MERRTVLRGLFAALGTSTLLGGCSGGLRPLYGTMGGNADAKLARVEISPIPGRIGQRIRNELRFQTEDRQGLPPNHRLAVVLRRSLTHTLVQRDGNSSGQVLNLDATFQLIDTQTQKVVLRGTSYARAGLERNPSIYANVRAVRDAENRAARTIAVDLKSRLAAFLATAA
jgi:LPS-assembly lipoprotein